MHIPRPFGFLSKQRIRSAAEFQIVFKQGKRFFAGCFVCHVLKTDRDYARLGVVTNKRNCRLATDRNRIRRRVREQCRLIQHQLAGMDVVIALKSSVEKITDQEQAQCIEKLLSQLVARSSERSSSS